MKEREGREGEMHYIFSALKIGDFDLLIYKVILISV